MQIRFIDLSRFYIFCPTTGKGLNLSPYSLTKKSYVVEVQIIVKLKINMGIVTEAVQINAVWTHFRFAINGSLNSALFFFSRNFLFAKKKTTTYIIYNTTYYYTTDIRITLLRAILTFLTLQYIHRIRYNTYATYDTRNYIIY